MLGDVSKRDLKQLFEAKTRERAMRFQSLSRIRSLLELQSRRRRRRTVADLSRKCQGGDKLMKAPEKKKTLRKRAREKKKKRWAAQKVDEEEIE